MTKKSSAKRSIKAPITKPVTKFKKLTPLQRAKILRNASIALNLVLPFIALKGKKRLMLIGAGVILDKLSKLK